MSYVIGHANATVFDLLAKGGVDDIEVGGESTVIYTESIPCLEGMSYSVEVKFSGTTVRTKVELEQGNVPVTTEGSASDDFVVPDGAAELKDAITGTDTLIKAYAPAATAYMRLKVTGNTSNGANTKLVRARITAIKS